MLVAMCGVQSAITQVGKDLHQQGNSLTNEHNAYLQGDLTAAEQRINRRRIYRRMGNLKLIQ